MRHFSAVLVAATVALMLAWPAAAQDDAPLTPDAVVAELQAAFFGVFTGTAEADIEATFERLTVMPAGEEVAASRVALMLFYGTLLAPPPEQVAEVEGDTALVKLQPETVEFVLVRQEGRWKVDMAATYQRMPQRLREAFQPLVELSNERTRQANCLSNLKQLALGALMYAQDHDETLPDADKWMDQLVPYLKNEAIYKCPGALDLEYGYAMNAALSGMDIKTIVSPATTVMFFDSDLGTRNAAGGPEAICDPPRHNGGNNYAYADGHATLEWRVPNFDPQAEAAAHAQAGPVVELTDASFEAEVLQAQGWVLVDFGADQCEPCRWLEPIFHQMAKQYEGRVKFASVDLVKCSKVPDDYGVRNIPTIILFRDGKQVDKQVGFGGEAAFRAWVAGHVEE